jgi:hypothetical protein
MITNDGKQIVAKFLLGQVPTFASHIAVGAGAEPLFTGASASISPDIDALDFEVFRVPILSRGLVKEGNEEKIVLKAEMPNDQRYKISEVGLYPGANNVVAGKYDSKVLITFSPAENWSYVEDQNVESIQFLNLPIDQGNENANIDGDIPDFLFINSEQNIFNSQQRLNRQEPPRFLNRSLLVAGDSSDINQSYSIDPESKYIKNSTLNFDLSQNLPNDKIKLAVSIISQSNNNNAIPDNVRIVVEFVNNLSNISTESPKAVGRFDITSGDIGSNRYQIVTRTISQFITDPTFSWANINLIRIYASTLENNIPTDDFYVLFDGMRIDNVTAINPLYSLVAYNVIATDSGTPITKEENTSNYIEYRFGTSVL